MLPNSNEAAPAGRPFFLPSSSLGSGQTRGSAVFSRQGFTPPASTSAVAPSGLCPATHFCPALNSQLLTLNPKLSTDSQL